MAINSANVNVLGNVGGGEVPSLDDLAGELESGGVEQSPCGFAFDYTESGIDSKDIPYRTYLLMKVWGLVKITLVHRLERGGEPKLSFDGNSTIECIWGEKQQVFVYDSKFSLFRIVVFVAGLAALFFQGPFLFAKGAVFCRGLASTGASLLTAYVPSLASTVISVLSFPWVVLLLAVISLQVVLYVCASVFRLVFPPVQAEGLFIFKGAFENTMQKLAALDCDQTFTREYLRAKERNILSSANNFMHAIKALNVVEEDVLWNAIENKWVSLLKDEKDTIDLRRVMSHLIREKKTQLKGMSHSIDRQARQPKQPRGVKQAKQIKPAREKRDTLEGKRDNLEEKRLAAKAQVETWQSLSSAMENMGWFTNVRATGISLRGKTKKDVAFAEVHVVVEKLKQELALFKNEQTQQNLFIWVKRELNVVRNLKMLLSAQRAVLGVKTS